MGTKKILLCINHKETEDLIMRELNNVYLCVGRITYREAVLTTLKNSDVDVLVIRDTLNGSIPIIQLIQQIRMEYSGTRIIFISKKRERKDPFLSELVSLGIYDIINKDIVTIEEIISHILEPRNFGDVSMYYIKRTNTPLEVEQKKEPQIQKKGLFSSLFHSSPKTTSQDTGSSFGFQSEELQEPAIDIDNLRAVIRKEEAIKAQAEKKQEIQSAIQQATIEQNRQIEELKRSNGELRRDVQRATDQAERAKLSENDAVIALETTKKQMNNMQNTIATMKREYTAQITSLSSMDSSAVMQEELNKKDQELQEMTDKLNQTEIMLQQMKAQQTEQTTVTVSDPADKERYLMTERELENAMKRIQELETEVRESASAIPENLSSGRNLSIEYNEEFIESRTGQSHSIVFMGSKHGNGNSTLALNTAVAMANKGQKVLLMEFNSNFPMINHFFEFINITNGIDTACDGILSGNTRAVDKAIIQPRQLKPQRRQLSRSYKKLPPTLHFMLYSNGFLTTENQGIDQRAIKDLFYYLTMQKQYAYIIIDIQPDDNLAKNLFLNSGFLADKLVLSLTQDTHSIVSAGYMLEKLAAGRSVNLAKEAVIVINKYQTTASIKKADIQKWLGLNPKSIICMSDDSAVYLDSSCYGVPYVCSKARFTGEYEDIVSAIS